MSTHAKHVDSEFLSSQKNRLLKLRTELQQELSAGANFANDQTLANGEAREQEDDAQKLDALELTGLQEKRQVDRLEAIGRALERIENGGYGISIVSGKPIPRDRLEAVPEALWNVDEKP